MTVLRKVRLGRWFGIACLEIRRVDPPCEWKIGVALYGTGANYVRLAVDALRVHACVHAGVFR